MKDDLVRIIADRARSAPRPCAMGCGNKTTDPVCRTCRRSASNRTVRKFDGPCQCGAPCGRRARGFSRMAKPCYDRLWKRDQQRSRQLVEISGVTMTATQVAATLGRVRAASAEQVAALRSAQALVEAIASGAATLTRRNAREGAGLRAAYGRVLSATRS